MEFETLPEQFDELINRFVSEIVYSSKLEGECKAKNQGKCPFSGEKLCGKCQLLTRDLEKTRKVVEGADGMLVYQATVGDIVMESKAASGALIKNNLRMAMVDGTYMAEVYY